MSTSEAGGGGRRRRPGPDGPRLRRSPDAVRASLLRAAAEVFAARGYRGAYTAEIGAVAGVAESAIFRHFGSKANLFAAAALEPFSRFIDDFAALWEARRQESDGDELQRVFVTDLYARLRDRRDIVQAVLLAADDDESPFAEEAQATFRRLFARLKQIGDAWADDENVRVPTIDLNERIVVGMVTAMVVFDRSLLVPTDKGERFAAEQVAEALFQVANRGALAHQDRPLRRTPPNDIS